MNEKSLTVNVIRESLPRKVCAITTYFNPAGFKTKRLNYAKFREGLKQIGLPLLTVELAVDVEHFVLGQTDAEYLIQLVAKDILWQKERLLNIGIRRIPDQYDKIIALDCDILFLNDDWLDNTCNLLEDYVLVQPFENCIRFPYGIDALDSAACTVGIENGQIFHGIARGVEKYGLKSLHQHHLHGEPGYGWACRRSIIEKNGFYDANIIGGGDSFFAQAAFGTMDFSARRLSLKHTEHYRKWAHKFFLDVQGSVAFSKGSIFHLWHGSRKNRNYRKRARILIENKFDPEKDLLNGDSNPWRWSGNNPGLETAVRKYFYSRKEDTPEHLFGAQQISSFLIRLGKMHYKLKHGFAWNTVWID